MCCKARVAWGSTNIGARVTEDDVAVMDVFKVYKINHSEGE